jgi:hypothetical protein
MKDYHVWSVRKISTGCSRGVSMYFIWALSYYEVLKTCTCVERVEAVLSHRIQPPAKFRLIVMFGAFRDAFNCLDCIQPIDRVTAEN